MIRARNNHTHKKIKIKIEHNINMSDFAHIDCTVAILYTYIYLDIYRDIDPVRVHNECVIFVQFLSVSPTRRNDVQLYGIPTSIGVCT